MTGKGRLPVNENGDSKREIKEKVLEVLEGGLKGSPASRFFSILMIVLILLSIIFMLIWDIDRFEPYHEIFEIIETITVGIFTLELILGFWTADVRFPDCPRPRLKYATSFMTIIQFLAILPFYLGKLLDNTAFDEIVEVFQILKLLHLLKIGEIGVHAAKEIRAERAEAEENPEEKAEAEGSAEAESSAEK